MPCTCGIVAQKQKSVKMELINVYAIKDYIYFNKKAQPGKSGDAKLQGLSKCMTASCRRDIYNSFRTVTF